MSGTSTPCYSCVEQHIWYSYGSLFPFDQLVRRSGDYGNAIDCNEPWGLWKAVQRTREARLARRCTWTWAGRKLVCILIEHSIGRVGIRPLEQRTPPPSGMNTIENDGGDGRNSTGNAIWPFCWVCCDMMFSLLQMCETRWDMRYLWNTLLKQAAMVVVSLYDNITLCNRCYLFSRNGWEVHWCSSTVHITRFFVNNRVFARVVY